MGSYAQSWLQAGGDIAGEAAEDQSGWSVALSGDGTIIAVGAPYNDGDSSKINIGRVRVYKYENHKWTQLGSDIDGDKQNGRFGYSLSISDDGTIIAVGAPNYQNSSGTQGLVRTYQYSSSSWSQLGGDLVAESSGDEYGTAVSLSGDGSIVAIGGPDNANGGHVRVFEYSSGSWTQLGDDIDGESSGDKSGYSVSLSNDGTIVAIGAYANYGGATASGHVRIHKYESGTWTQLGGDIDGDEVEDRSGNSISLSSDGTRVAIGAWTNDDNGELSGHVRVFEYSSGSWTKLGSNIVGEASSDRFGHSVSISSDGSKFAAGAIYNDGAGNGSGHIRVFEYSTSSTSWIKVGSDIDGKVETDEIGFSVAISNDGTKVAGGAKNADFGGVNETRF